MIYLPSWMHTIIFIVTGIIVNVSLYYIIVKIWNVQPFSLETLFLCMLWYTAGIISFRKWITKTPQF